MTLQEKIIKDLKEAMKSGNTEKRDLLRVVVGEFNRVGKELSDDVAQKEVKKMYMNAKELGSESEATILEEYIPQELTKDQLTMLIQDMIEETGVDSMKGMGRIMGMLAKEYPNRYDGKLASQIVKEILS